jgi:hypothetical protein
MESSHVFVLSLLQIEMNVLNLASHSVRRGKVRHGENAGAVKLRTRLGDVGPQKRELTAYSS